MLSYIRFTASIGTNVNYFEVSDSF
jgi:hypothetical protein